MQCPIAILSYFGRDGDATGVCISATGGRLPHVSFGRYQNTYDNTHMVLPRTRGPSVSVARGLKMTAAAAGVCSQKFLMTLLKNLLRWLRGHSTQQCGTRL
jgi:hypothetical protein